MAGALEEVAVAAVSEESVRLRRIGRRREDARLTVLDVVDCWLFVGVGGREVASAPKESEVGEATIGPFV